MEHYQSSEIVNFFFDTSPIPHIWGTRDIYIRQKLHIAGKIG